MEHITSRNNPLVLHVRKLVAERKYRQGQGQVLCEGPKMLEEALRWGARLEVLIGEEGYVPPMLPTGVRQVTVPPTLLRHMADTETPQRVLFLCGRPDTTPPSRLLGRRYLVLDGLQDPGNVGTLWRTADAFGADGVFLLPGCADPFSPKVLRATMGACFRLPVWQGTLAALLPLCEGAGLPLYATALRADTVDLRAADLSQGAAVVIGSEGRGVSAEVLSAATGSIKIPMTPRCESLNAASAGSVVLWRLCGEGL